MPRPTLCAALALLAPAMLLAGCNQSPNPAAPQAAAPPTATYQNVPAGVTPAGFRLPEGTGCKGAVARWAAIQDNDLRSGHVSPAVYKTIQGEIAAARAACDAGRDAQATGMVRASRARHGYPAG